MKKIVITKNEAGMQLDKYLKKIFLSMPESLLHKLFRKKYFEINGKKATEKSVIKVDDEIDIYLADETFDKFYKNSNGSDNDVDKSLDVKDNIVFEDDNVIIFNKPAGMLSQGDKSGDESVNTILNKYLGGSKSAFKPSIVNRLDRNTNGIIIFAKTYIAAKEISEMIRKKDITKLYKAKVNGIIKNDTGELVNLYTKDEKSNKAIIKDYNDSMKLPSNYTIIKLKYRVLKRNANDTDLEIDLITGKSHQIRAQFAYIGHPIVCDKKYMNRELYDDNVSKYKRKSQILTCYKVRFGDFADEKLKYLSKKQFVIK